MGRSTQNIRGFGKKGKKEKQKEIKNKEK